MTARRASRKSPAFMAAVEHGRLWRLVEGGVLDAFRSHPDYLTAKGEQAAVESIVKRVVGQLVGHAKGTRKGGGAAARGGHCRAQAVEQGRSTAIPLPAQEPDGRGDVSPPGRTAGDGA